MGGARPLSLGVTGIWGEGLGLGRPLIWFPFHKGPYGCCMCLGHTRTRGKAGRPVGQSLQSPELMGARAAWQKGWREVMWRKRRQGLLVDWLRRLGKGKVKATA